MMYKLRAANLAADKARETGLSYGWSILSPYWYVGTPEQLERIGVVDVKPTPAGQQCYRCGADDVGHTHHCSVRFGFTDGGFAVVDDTNRKASFAYASSPGWTTAKQCRGWELAEFAAKMLRNEHSYTVPDNIREQHYLAVSSDLNQVTSCYTG